MLVKPSDPQGLHAKFLQAFNDDAIKACAAVVAAAHLRVHGVCSERWGEVGAERCGYIRWMQIESDLLAHDGKFPGVKVEFVRNRTCGGRHVEVVAGQFRMLFVHAADPLEIVPKSEYGKTLAKSNAWTLFADVIEEEPATVEPQAGYYYAVMFHSKGQRNGMIPSRLEVRFPDGADGYAADHLNLYSLYHELMDERWLLTQAAAWSAAPTETAAVAETVAAEETIKEEAMPKRRRAGQVGN